MTAHKHAFGGQMPGLEGMGPLRTGIMVVVIAMIAFVAIAAMLNGVDSARGGVAIEAAR